MIMNYKHFNTLHEKSFIKSALLLYLIWPLLGLYVAFSDYKQDWSKNIFWLFCIFFGLTFIIAEEGGADSDRYARLFIYYAHFDLDLKELWGSFYAEGSGYVDIISPLIIYLVSRITDNPSILFAVFGLIFGYFYSRNIWYVLGRVNGKLTGIVLLYFLTFALLNPIWNINGFRFNAAAQIFLFGTLPYLLGGKSKSLIWSVASIFVHFSFLFPVAILGLFYLLKNRLNIYLLFFVLSAFIKEIDLQWVQSSLLFLPDVLFSKVLTYANPEYAEGRRIMYEELPWFITYSSIGLRWVSYIIVLSIFLFGRKMLKERCDMTTLLCFSLLLFGFANIFSLVPIGGRFLVVTYTFMFAFFIIYFAAFPKVGDMLIIKALSIPLLLLFCIVAIRIGMDYFGLTTILGNPFSAALYSDPVPLITAIKRLF